MSVRPTVMIFVGVADPVDEWAPNDVLWSRYGEGPRPRSGSYLPDIELAGIRCEPIRDHYSDVCFGFGAMVLEMDTRQSGSSLDLLALHTETERLRALLAPEFAALGLDPPQVHVAVVNT